MSHAVVGCERNVSGGLQVVHAREHDDEVGAEVEIPRRERHEALQARPAGETPVRDVRGRLEERAQPRGPGARVVRGEEVERRRPALAEDAIGARGFRDGDVAHVRDALAPRVEMHNVSRRLEDRIGTARHDEDGVRPIGPPDLLDESRVGRNLRLGPLPRFQAKRRAAAALEKQEQGSGDRERQKHVRQETADQLHAAPIIRSVPAGTGPANTRAA